MATAAVASRRDRRCSQSVLFVKLWQFTAGDTAPLRLDTRAGEWRQGLVPGLTVLPLHSHDGIDTALVRWAPHTRFQPHTHPGGEEILVLQGVFSDEWGHYPQGSWLRSPRIASAYGEFGWIAEATLEGSASAVAEADE